MFDSFLEHAPRNLFFTGKGGVGKTSVACATAVKLADQGKRVLLVSTDPASNLDEVLGVSLTNKPTPVPLHASGAIATSSTLYALNLDPEKAAAEYRERMVAPYRGLLPPAAIASMEEQFSGSCTLEIAAFDEFSRLLGDPTATHSFDHVVFDTAPTGHTLRLLTLPSAWSGFMEQNTSGTSCLGPLAGLQAQQSLYRETVKALSDPATTTLVLVARAEKSALREAARTSEELATLGVANQSLIINAMFEAHDTSDPVAMAMQRRGEVALSESPVALKQLPTTYLRWKPTGVLGLESLRALFCEESIESLAERQPKTSIPMQPFGTLIQELAKPGHGVILAMGKGGVGKTTIATAVAMGLAELGYSVHLTTTDPAAHIAATLGAESLPGLTVGRIDPVAETEKYRREVMQKAGSTLDAAGKALLEEDLRSPCTEEIAVFRAFADAVASAANRFVVLDTAPTGHTILLLDSALAYHREVTRQTSEMPEAVTQLLPRLRDPEFTRVLIVTLPEATPVHEAASLQRDLRRAQIEPFAWIVNQSLHPIPVTDPLLLHRQIHEEKYLQEVISTHSKRAVLIPWHSEPPVGREQLDELIHS
ncbi:MAG: arsenical pump-driving ATPase [Pirellula sp.]|jgi:arsenite-transporting ATPase|nr:arsenical pump-driving ATPase [Pirellula sp.]